MPYVAPVHATRLDTLSVFSALTADTLAERILMREERCALSTSFATALKALEGPSANTEVEDGGMAKKIVEKTVSTGLQARCCHTDLHFHPKWSMWEDTQTALVDVGGLFSYLELCSTLHD